MSTDGGYLARFARLALDGVRREYPNHIAHVMRDASQVGSPKRLHPAFYGCYDWHSSVHGHWLLVRLLRAGAGVELPESEMREALAENLTAENVRVEDEYFREPGRAPYERPYGWAWLLKLHEELYLWDDPDAARWFDALRPLAATITGKYLDFFPKQRYPIRVGTHFNTAFGLAFAWDYAAALARGVGKSLDAGVLESLADFGGGQSSDITAQQMHEQPVAVHGRVPVVAAVKRRVQSLRRADLRGVAHDVCDVVRVLPAHAVEREPREPCEVPAVS